MQLVDYCSVENKRGSGTAGARAQFEAVRFNLVDEILSVRHGSDS